MQLNLEISSDLIKIYFLRALSLSRDYPITSIGEIKCWGLLSARF